MRHEAEQFSLDFSRTREFPSAVQNQEFNGETFEKKKDGKRLQKQHITVFNIMKSGEWITLAELEELTGIPQASVSARVRELRQPKFGGYTVERRRRTESGGTNEYRLKAGGAA